MIELASLADQMVMGYHNWSMQRREMRAAPIYAVSNESKDVKIKNKKIKEWNGGMVLGRGVLSVKVSHVQIIDKLA